MRKRNIDFCFDTIFWYILYALPVICFIFSQFNFGGVAFGTFIDNIGLGLAENNFVFECLSGIFGVEGILPLFADTGFILFCTYFVCVWLMHLLVDFLLFIPRFCHEVMDKVGGCMDV